MTTADDRNLADTLTEFRDVLAQVLLDARAAGVPERDVLHALTVERARSMRHLKSAVTYGCQAFGLESTEEP